MTYCTTYKLLFWVLHLMKSLELCCWTGEGGCHWPFRVPCHGMGVSQFSVVALINPMVRLITPSLDEMQYVAVGVAQRYLLLKTSESRF